MGALGGEEKKKNRTYGNVAVSQTFSAFFVFLGKLSSNNQPVKRSSGFIHKGQRAENDLSVVKITEPRPQRCHPHVP